MYASNRLCAVVRTASLSNHSLSFRAKIRKIMFYHVKKEGKRKVQGVSQSQTEALPRPQEEEETDKLNKHKPNKRTKSTKISSLFPK